MIYKFLGRIIRMKVMLWGLGGNSKIFLKMLEENFCGNFEVTGIFENSLDSIPFKTELPIFKTQKELYNLIKVSTHFIISIGGNGLARYQVSRKLKSMAKGMNIDFLSYVSEKQKVELLSKSWVFCSPSLVEGFGITFIEAASYGKPSIAGKFGGEADAVQEGKTGYLCDGNDLNDL